MRCPKCGAENAEGLTFCKTCWTSFRGSAESPLPKKDEASPRGPLFGVPYVDERRDVHDTPSWSASERTPQYLSAIRGHDADRVRIEADAGPSPRSVLTLILGLLSVVLFCLFYLTIPVDLAGFVLGIFELREINRGAAPRAGRSFATAGVILSGFALVVKLIIFFAIRV